jgi:hypothetical protein
MLLVLLILFGSRVRFFKFSFDIQIYAKACSKSFWALKMVSFVVEKKNHFFDIGLQCVHMQFLCS